MMAARIFRKFRSIALLVVLAACSGQPVVPPAETPLAGPSASPVLEPSPTLLATPASTPAPAPTSSPTPGATLQEATQASITVDQGGQAKSANGLTVVIPPAAVSADATLTLTPVDIAPSAPTAANPLRPVSGATVINMTGGSLTSAATIAVPYDPASLPQGSGQHDLVLTYLDDSAGVWVPVSSSIDEAQHVVTTSTDHFSTWRLQDWNWDYWLAFLKQAASGKVTNLLQAVSKLTTPCFTHGGSYVVQNKPANHMIQGCVRTGSYIKAKLEVLNLRSFYLQLSSPQKYFKPTLLAPGDGITFDVPSSDPSPLSVSVDLSNEALWTTVIDIVLRLVPGGDLLASEKDYLAALGVIVLAAKPAWEGAHIVDDIQSQRYAKAAESVINVITDESTIELLAQATAAAGQRYGIERLSALSTESLRRILTYVGLTELIVSTWEFAGNALFNQHVEATVKWVPVPRPLPSLAQITALALAIAAANPNSTANFDRIKDRLRIAADPRAKAEDRYYYLTATAFFISGACADGRMPGFMAQLGAYAERTYPALFVASDFGFGC